jgi:uroporphyrin-III C-methyltransferase
MSQRPTSRIPPRNPARAHRGRVLLVGAGPGDPDLLTLKAAKAIAQADVILIDDLVNRAVLAHARDGVRVVTVGKRGGSASTAQSFIERLMVNEALAGRTVVRLKGGDPFLFGRGGEELARLRDAGIPAEVIPGITSGLAAPLAAGVSVTHRDHSPGMIFVTGHEKDATRERIDWALLARSGLTLVVYMGVTNAARIQQKLLDGGLCGATPVAAIQNATLPTQRVACGTLATLAETLARDAIGSPAILVIGEAARAAQAVEAQAAEWATAVDGAPVSPALRAARAG